ncbi:hypothetical protein SPSIL_024510 [Sporomusa silvacetica DSM 10669]|uniref:Uncharacterized protein n=1 Tax=Sporomusa silvacetica DSM 10669 TaxID=1123289 RepID=A0ABZ3IL06_9FIRM|nr:hypothetical protein SPSIL_04730 [Sporomusa silvacetica DSM 10669]
MAGTSRVNREVYARFCGRLVVKFLRPTRRCTVPEASEITSRDNYNGLAEVFGTNNLSGAAGIGVLTSRERFSEITTGKSYFQQGW